MPDHNSLPSSPGGARDNPHGNETIERLSWFDRINKAVESFEGWSSIPLPARMDRVFKESGVRDLVVENEALAADLADARRERDETGEYLIVMTRRARAAEAELPTRRKRGDASALAETVQTACPKCGTPRTESPCERCGVTWIPLPWTTVLHQWRARMVGYEAYVEARTQHNDGDGIWDFYAIKTWSNLTYWRDKATKAESALADAQEALRAIEGLRGYAPIDTEATSHYAQIVDEASNIARKALGVSADGKAGT